MSESAMLARLVAREDLAGAEVEELFGRIVDGRVPDTMIAGLLAALATKGETPEEIAGAVRALRTRVRPVPHHRERVVDTCGTGGDGRGTFNVSTAAAFVAAAAGVPVAKHGNRAVTSRSGSADVMAALGLPIEVEPEDSARQLDALGLAFLFAPLHHPAMKAVAPVRRSLGVRTVFNLIGPLTNPAGARRQVMGVFAPERVETVAQVLAGLGCEHALVVHGRDGLDEITTTGPTWVAEVTGGRVRTFEVRPADLGLAEARLEQIAGGTPAENAERLEHVLAGGHGALGDLVAANAGAAIYVGGMAPDLAAGTRRAREILASGAAREKLEALRAFE